MRASLRDAPERNRMNVRTGPDQSSMMIGLKAGSRVETEEYFDRG